MMNRTFLRTLIRHHTKLSRDHLTPELGLHLITSDCHLWRAGQDNSPFDDPFWAFYWPGGQALTRYILDHPGVFKGKSILDVGSGCGSAAVACQLIGAAKVVANDIDPVAAVAIELNTEENETSVNIDTSDHLGGPLREHFDVVLLGDMFYDPDFTNMISDWLRSLSSETTVLIGDPGRLPFINHPMKTALHCVSSYALPKTCQLENNGLSDACVWRLGELR